MAPIFEKIAILGLGLLGGSLALDLQHKKLSSQIYGYNRSPKNRGLALKRKACHQVFDSAKEAVKEADLVVLATPVDSMISLVQEIGPFLKPKTLLTDLGSTKASLVSQLPKLLPKGVYFLGGHPMAGSHQSGMAQARLDLFKEKFWFLCPNPQEEKKPIAKKLKNNFKKLIQKLGAKPVFLEAKAHDRLLANISHLPQMLAYALMHSQLNIDQGLGLAYAGSGFLDTSRLAASSPEMWIGIAKENQKPLLKALQNFSKSLNKIEKALERKDFKSLTKYFEEVSQERQKL
ncbi:MAG: prephenate dehydrogenase [Deltaproteobacteria bacterium]|nr:prephenate dehydrogenase [Deltaproteobacteria bacterium]